MKSFDDKQLHFEYPDGWQVVRDDAESQITITVEGPGTAFWMVSILLDCPTAEEIIEQGVESLRSEYPQCDVYDGKKDICLLPTISKQIDFFKYELVNRACLFACEAADASVLVLYQLSDEEAEELEPILEAMTDSLMWDSADIDDEHPIDLFQFDNLFAPHGSDES